MGLLSILLSALALICAGFGVLTSIVPGLGVFFAFGAPALAIVGVMVGGSAMSRAKRSGQVNETARIGVILNAVAFVPGLLVALTCGVCNAMFSTGDMRMQRDIRFGPGGPFAPDAGARALPPPQWAAGSGGGAAGAESPPARQTPPGAPAQTGAPPTSKPAEPEQPPSAPASPGGALPPPPLPAGPGR